jgi:hypothetical protein
MRFYRITFRETRDTLIRLSEDITEEQLQKNLESGAEITGVSGKDGELVGHLLADTLSLSVVTEYLGDNGINYDLDDVTDDVLSFSYEITDEEAIELLQTLREFELTPDHVLDKLNRHGMGSLDKFDMEVLKRV